MSRKCCSQAARDRYFARRDAQSAHQRQGIAVGAAGRPETGIVIPTIPRRSSPSRSNARTVTSSASVESSPPEMPTTAFVLRVCASRRANPVA